MEFSSIFSKTFSEMLNMMISFHHADKIQRRERLRDI